MLLLTDQSRGFESFTVYDYSEAVMLKRCSYPGGFVWLNVIINSWIVPKRAMEFVKFDFRMTFKDVTDFLT